MAAHIAPKGSEQGGHLQAAGLSPFVLTAQTRRNGGDDLISGLGSGSWSLGSWRFFLQSPFSAVQLARDPQGRVCAIPSPSYRAGAFPSCVPVVLRTSRCLSLPAYLLRLLEWLE